jgi:predicted DsbA family dithiol-disulfide isomerase
VRAVLWSDYICPWCYLGRDRTQLLAQLGVTVDHRAFDLHPEMPEHGTTVRPGGRLEAVLERIAVECREIGLPFSVPARLPRSRLALETAEVVRAHHLNAFAALDDALFAAVFVAPRDIADQRVIDELVCASGAPADAVRTAVDAGDGARLLEESMSQAREHGVAATPAWLVDDRLVIPGALPRDQITRWVHRMSTSRSGGA